jgi:hypothetical protein
MRDVLPPSSWWSLTSLMRMFVVLRSRASAITYAHSYNASLAQLGTSPQQVKKYMSFWYSPKYQSFSHSTDPTQQSHRNYIQLVVNNQHTGSLVSYISTHEATASRQTGC